MTSRKLIVGDKTIGGDPAPASSPDPTTVTLYDERGTPISVFPCPDCLVHTNTAEALRAHRDVVHLMIVGTSGQPVFNPIIMTHAYGTAAVGYTHVMNHPRMPSQPGKTIA